MIARFLLAALLLIAAAANAASTGAAQTVVHILDYVAVDYAGAVENGKVKSEGEYKEMLEFSTQVVEQIRTLQPKPQLAALSGDAQALAKLVADKADAAKVAQNARKLRAALIQTYELAVTPQRPPDMAHAAVVYAQQCAACHGAQGRGDGPAAKGMEPPPANFHDAERMAQRDRYGLFNTITLGVPGTPMKSYAALSEDERWGLAYYVAAFSAGSQSPLVYARKTLNETLAAYKSGEHARAQQLAVAAYLEGFEIVEPALDAVDHPLRDSIERDMLKLRNLMRDRAPLGEVQALAEHLVSDLENAEAKIGGTALSPTAAATSAFIILLREGLEAILVVAALIAFLVKAGRREALVYIHAGWIGALVLGAATWFVASYAVSMSGAGREMTEGITALASTLILLYVGYWLHDKSHARAWKDFIETRLSGALSGGTIWALASLSFLAVYREVFETVLFYQALWVQAGPAAHAVVGGFAAAAAALVLVAWLIFRYGVRLPIGLFFTVSSVFLAALAVVFAGQGIAALQEAGVIDATVIAFPRIAVLGIFPTIQSLAAQAFVVAVVLAALAWSRYGPRAAHA
jgi:high-affinity iron transporter